MNRRADGLIIYLGIVMLMSATTAAVFSACSFPSSQYTTVREITKDPAAYEGKTITLRGKVTGVVTLPPMTMKFYMLSDGTGEITVMTSKEVPAVNSEVRVKGTVENTAILEGTSMGVHVEELGRS